uniref:peroxidase family protein n=1 Tax=uncultured Caulobacter sp. TaxID=158749 RepID=UPI0025F31203|nr:heme peroxidase family protein [uncultured Caulobacter sp.]
MASSRHGSAVRGLLGVPQSSIRDARFGRMFRNLPPAVFGERDDQARAALIALAATMLQGEFDAKIAAGKPVDVPLNEPEPEDENPDIPAGYTYLGQFIDHDITFDPVSSLDRFNDPDALQDFRTPRLDLDSVYGSGPDDQPFLYEEDGKHLLLGDDKDFDEARNARPDLPRNTAAIRRALIGDKRNDENLIVSQLHSLFLRFHNRVLDTEAGGDFLEAQRIVRWHYQWIVLHDFLPRILGQETYEEIIGGRDGFPELTVYNSKGRYAYMPVEFAVAAYRYGHSQVRPSYALNHKVQYASPSTQLFHGKNAKFNRIPIFSLMDPPPPLANLNGFRELPDSWAIDWAFFYPDLEPDNPDELIPEGAVLPQPSYKLDTVLVDPLESLPDHQMLPPELRSLAVLNLLRGWRMELPSGQSVARRLSIPELTAEELFDNENADRRTARAKVLAEHPALGTNTPLWFYILREAELLTDGVHLGPVGGTIIAEVLAGLMIEDRHSFLAQWPTWRPTLPSAVEGHFTMSDLVRFTEDKPPPATAASAG